MNQEVEIINQAWESNKLDNNTKEVIQHIISKLDQGIVRSAVQLEDGRWQASEMVKKAILLYFRSQQNYCSSAGPNKYFDKIPLKFEDEGCNIAHFGSRVLPGAIVRYGSYIGKQVILMPSFVNIGAYVGDGTMVDSWSTIGSCAQIGKNCHISGGAGIGGVLEPLQATPVVIEDDCFIGARSEIAEGVHVGKGAVISMGVYIGASTKIIDRMSGKIYHSYVPPYSVVVPGTLPAKEAGMPSLYCAVIVKKVDAQTRSKVSINEILREI